MTVEAREKKAKFSLVVKDAKLERLLGKTAHKTLAVWAADCAGRVLHYFEEKYPEDKRPRKAIETLLKWRRTGVFRMAEIRGASLASHAAAREVGEDNSARSAARAAGQAVATAHVFTHSIGAANYTLQAVYRAAIHKDADKKVAKEREWQYKHLVKLSKKSSLVKKAVK